MTRRSGQLGPAAFVSIVHRLADRATGTPLSSQRVTVDTTGRQHPVAGGGEQRYCFGAPLDARTPVRRRSRDRS